MAKKALYFISILTDFEKFDQDLEKIGKIISSNPSVSTDTEIKMLWAPSPGKLDPNLDILHQSLFNNFTSTTTVPGSTRILPIEQVICNEENPFEQLALLQNEGVLSDEMLKNLTEIKSSKEWQEGFKKLRHLDKEDAAAYATERVLGKNESALSNILITSLAQDTSLDYGDSISYINLEGISDTQAENILSEIEENPNSITKESKHIKGIGLDFSRTKERDEIEQFLKSRGEPYNYYNSTLNNINHQRNLRYKALKAQAEKRTGFLYRMLSFFPDLFTRYISKKKSSAFEDYKKGKLVSELTAEGLIKDVEKKMRGSDSFLEKLRKILEKPRKRSIIKKIEKELIKELTEEIAKKDIPEGVKLLSYLPDILNQFKKAHTSEADYKKIARHFLKKHKDDLFASFKDASGKPDVNGKDELGNAPLHLAAGSKELLEILVEEYGADINIKDVQGGSPAFIAASFGNIEGLEYLNSKGADLRQVDKEGNNILYSLVGDHIPNNPRDLREVTGYLLKKGINPTEENHFGKSPSDRAFFEDKKDLYELFLKAYPKEVESRTRLNFPIKSDTSFVEDLLLDFDKKKDEILAKTPTLSSDDDSGYDTSSSSSYSSESDNESTLSQIDIESPNKVEPVKKRNRHLSHHSVHQQSSF